jgi:hypothetical protein
MYHARWAPPDIGLWTKVKKNAEARRLGYTKRRFMGLDKAPDSSLTNVHLQSGPR